MIKGWFERIFAIRKATEPQHPDDKRFWQSPKTAGGVVVNPDTAVTVAAVWACLRYLSQTVAVLPWHVMQDGDKGAEVQKTHPFDRLLYKRPNPEWSSFQFRETLTHWALRWGNGYAEIERDVLGRPIALWPIHPDRVQIKRNLETRALYYEVSNGVDGKSFLAPEEMFHIRGFGEGPVGVNVIEYAAQSIGWAKAAQIFGAAFFGNGATPTTVVMNKNPISLEALELQRKEFENLYKGPWRSNKTAFLDNEAEIKSIGVDAQKSQLIQTHQHLIEEICRWFGVPPHKISHLLRATFSNIEHQAIEVVVDSVSPWVKRFEDEADYKLFGRNPFKYYTKMNMRALLRGDTNTRISYYEGMIRIGAYSPNRVLELEDENTIGPDGDIHTMQSQNVTLERIRKDSEDPPEPQQMDLPLEAANDDEVVPEPGEEANRLASQFETTAGLIHV